MTLDEVLAGLFPSGHRVAVGAHGCVTGTATRKTGTSISVIGVAHVAALGTAGVLPLAAHVLEVIASLDESPHRPLDDTARVERRRSPQDTLTRISTHSQ